MSQQLQQDFRAYLDRAFVSQTKAAKKMGLSAATISTWLKGEYKGDTDRIDAVVEKFLSKQREREASPRKSEPFTATSVVREFFGLARLCQNEGKMGVCVGESGVGKTRAARKYAEESPGVILLEVDYGYTAYILMQELHRALRGDGSGRLHYIQLDIVERLRDSERLIIIDEAEHLPYEALEGLRRIHDHAQVGILLVGMPRLYENVWGLRGQYKQLHTRVSGQYAKLNYISSSDAQAIAELYIPGANGIAKTFYQCANHNTRLLTNLIVRSKQNAEAAGVDVNDEIIHETAGQMILK